MASGWLTSGDTAKWRVSFSSFFVLRILTGPLMIEWRGLLTNLSEKALVHAVGKLVNVNILVNYRPLFSCVRCVSAKLYVVWQGR